ncbi:ATPase [Salinimicrobium sp. HB62]|uniref:ATPase n=1 Tax=Salinimicrobium sp. HB62 TaxID=3077781 RepID=UPI002D773F80|nr:ATPase [Salinimicrobium sp. HB62]
MKILKASGERAEFQESRVAASLRRAGAKEHVIVDILNTLRKELYEDISTKEIYKRAYYLLKKQDGLTASRYKLKKAIYELGPTGFPFEKFIAAVFEHSGYKVEVGNLMQGICVKHEVDVLAMKENRKLFIECKFHGDQAKKCDVKIPLYINSRFIDLKTFQLKTTVNTGIQHEGWVVTNSRFTEDAITYGRCAGLKLLGWDYPEGSSLKERIDSLGLYPITVSNLLSGREKQFLLSRDVVLCRQLVQDNFFLDKLEIGNERKHLILNEIEKLIVPLIH